MENLLKLCLFLLCFETVVTVQCVLCHSYKNRECVGGIQTCTAKPGETCMIRRTWYASETVALRCKECSSYLHKKCKHRMKECIAEEGESCMIIRTWSPPNNVNNPTGGSSRCQKNCTIDEYEYSDTAILTSCCDKHDFCNDINVPVDEWY